MSKTANKHMQQSRHNFRPHDRSHGSAGLYPGSERRTIAKSDIVTDKESQQMTNVKVLCDIGITIYIDVYAFPPFLTVIARCPRWIPQLRLLHKRTNPVPDPDPCDPSV